MQQEDAGRSLSNKKSKRLPVKDSGSDSVGVVLDPRRIFKDFTTRAVLLEVFVGDLSCEDSLSIVLVHGEGRESSDRHGGLAARNSFDSGGGDEHGQRVFCDRYLVASLAIPCTVS